MSEEKEYQLSKKDLAVYKRVIKTFMQSINNTLDRQDTIRDPMTRNTLILDKLCSGLDLLVASAEILPKELGFDREFCEDIAKTSSRVKRVTNSLFQWVQHPTYTTEHPVGQEMMQKGQTSLDSLN